MEGEAVSLYPIYLLKIKADQLRSAFYIIKIRDFDLDMEVFY